MKSGQRKLAWVGEGALGRAKERRWKQGLSTKAFNQTKGLKNIDIYAWWIRHHCESIPRRFFS